VSDPTDSGAERRPSPVDAATGADALSVVELETVLATGREGLPGSYRMRLAPSLVKVGCRMHSDARRLDCLLKLAEQVRGVALLKEDRAEQVGEWPV